MRKKFMKLIYMIINYNDANTVKNLISQLHHFKKVDEILVVDNHSIDDSFKELKKLPIKKLRVIETRKSGMEVPLTMVQMMF